MRCDCGDRGVVAGAAEQIHGDDRCGQIAGRRARRQHFGEQLRIQVPAQLLGIHEHRASARVIHCECGGGEGQGRHDDVIAWLHADGHHPQLQCCGSRGQGNRMSSAGQCADVGFEGIDLRAKWRNPATAQCGGDVLDLDVGDLRRGEIDAFTRVAHVIPRICHRGSVKAQTTPCRSDEAFGERTSVASWLRL